MEEQRSVAKPADNKVSDKMETSSDTPLLEEDGSDASTPTADEVQHDASGHPSKQSTVNSIHRLPSASPPEQREPAGAPLATISCESVNIGVPTTTEQVIPCMCCEGSHDHDIVAVGLATQSDGTRNTQTGRLQNGTAASAGATTGSPPDRPQLETSQSLPAILIVPDHTHPRPNQTQPSNEARCQPSPHQPAGQISSVRHARVTGTVSDSMLSLPTGDICRICHTGRRHEPLLGPCLCAGSMRYTHQRCLTTWLAQSGRSRCELCGYKFKTRMVGSRNIFQWKMIHLSMVDKLHLIVFALSLVLFVGTTAYIAWSASRSDFLSSGDLNSVAAQILLPVYCSLSFVSLGLLVYETKSTCLRLARRWRALNMGLQIVERELDDEGDVQVDDSAARTGPLRLERLMEAGNEGLTTGRVRAVRESRADAERGRLDRPPSDWSVWTES